MKQNLSSQFRRVFFQKLSKKDCKCSFSEQFFSSKSLLILIQAGFLFILFVWANKLLRNSVEYKESFVNQLVLFPELNILLNEFGDN